MDSEKFAVKSTTKIRNQSQSQKTRGSNSVNALAVIFGAVLLVAVQSALLWSLFAILRDSDIVDWNPSVFHIIGLATVVVLWSGIQRAVFLGALTNNGRRNSTNETSSRNSSFTGVGGNTR